MEVRALALKVQFMQQTLAQVCEHVREFIAFADLSVRVDEFRNLLECFEVFYDLFTVVGALHLYYHRATIAHGCAMHLRQ